MSPHLLLLGAAKRWNQLVRGACTLTTHKAAKDAAEVHLGYPQHLFSPLYVTALGASLRAAAAATGAKRTSSKVVEVGDTRATVHIGWS